MRSVDVRDIVFTEYAKTCIRVKARQLAKRSEFRRSDEDDLQQELWLALLKKAHRFDSHRGSSNTFVDRVLNNAAGMMVRHPYRKKRAPEQKAISIERFKISDADGTKDRLENFLSNADLSRRTGANDRDEYVCYDDAKAISHALSEMPEEMRDVCRHMMGGSISAAARDLGMSRRRIREALQSARPYFEQAGFESQ